MGDGGGEYEVKRGEKGREEKGEKRRRRSRRRRRGNETEKKDYEEGTSDKGKYHWIEAVAPCDQFREDSTKYCSVISMR
jgi:hypothetical protein